MIEKIKNSFEDIVVNSYFTISAALIITLLAISNIGGTVNIITGISTFQAIYVTFLGGSMYVGGKFLEEENKK